MKVIKYNLNDEEAIKVLLEDGAVKAHYWQYEIPMDYFALIRIDEDFSLVSKSGNSGGWINCRTENDEYGLWAQIYKKKRGRSMRKSSSKESGMNDVEALNALVDGKKIREPDWEEGRYLCLKKGNLVNESNTEGKFLGNYFSNRWEVYRPKLILDKGRIKNFVDEYELEISKNTLNEIFRALEKRFDI